MMIALVRRDDTRFSPKLGVTATALRNLVLGRTPSLQALLFTEILIVSQLEGVAVVPDCAECPLLQRLEHMALDSNTLCCSCREIGSVAWCCAAQQTSSSL